MGVWGLVFFGFFAWVLVGWFRVFCSLVATGSLETAVWEYLTNVFLCVIGMAGSPVKEEA